MTATERLCELLDERGVEWAEYGDGYTLLRHGGREYTVQPNVCNRLIVTNLTPEQAIAATLGSCNCSNSERTNEPCLPYWWTHDGTLHVELPKLPESISVRLPDARDREVGSARVWRYTRSDIDATDARQGDATDAKPTQAESSGTCHDLAETPSYRDKTEFKCSECGYEYSAVGGFGCDSGDEPDFNFCPNCGRRIEVDA